MSLATRYGNVVSGSMGCTLPKPDAKIGDWATILAGRDRHPAKISGIVYAKNGNVKGYILQRMTWKMDNQTEGYPVKDWENESVPNGDTALYLVRTHGKLKGTVKDAFIGRADPFYDRSF